MKYWKLFQTTDCIIHFVIEFRVTKWITNHNYEIHLKTFIVQYFMNMFKWKGRIGQNELQSNVIFQSVVWLNELKISFDSKCKSTERTMHLIYVSSKHLNANIKLFINNLSQCDNKCLTKVHEIIIKFIEKQKNCCLQFDSKPKIVNK